MAEKFVPDPLAGVPGGLTDRKGEYPLADRRADQGYDVDTPPEEEVEVEQATENLKPVENIPDEDRELTDPPGQPITSPSEPRTVKVPQEPITEGEHKNIFVGSPPGDEAPTTGVERFRTHEQIDAYAKEKDVQLPEVWSSMTLVQKRRYLG